jgi:hypothetical protein
MSTMIQDLYARPENPIINLTYLIDRVELAASDGFPWRKWKKAQYIVEAFANSQDKLVVEPKMSLLSLYGALTKAIEDDGQSILRSFLQYKRLSDTEFDKYDYYVLKNLINKYSIF